MESFSWGDFWEQYNRALIAYVEDGGEDYVEDEVTPEVIASGWLGFPGASEDELLALEARLKTTLPPSYRAFLALSNGFLQPGQLVPRLFSTKEVDWYIKQDPETVAVWTKNTTDDNIPDDEYFAYDDQVAYSMRSEHLKSVLVISATETAGTAVYLLNPKVVTKEGEWEAWMFAHWIPGANRYRSFRDLMQAQYKQILDHAVREKGRYSPKDTPDALPTKLPFLIQQIDEKIEIWRNVASPTASGTIEGLNEVKTQVVALQTKNLDGVHLRDALRQCAAELERKQQTHAHEMMPHRLENYAKAIGAGMKGMLEAIQQASVFEGYREAAGIIRWFLNE